VKDLWAANCKFNFWAARFTGVDKIFGFLLTNASDIVICI
jgi:hypothetical protein